MASLIYTAVNLMMYTPEYWWVVLFVIATLVTFALTLG